MAGASEVSGDVYRDSTVSEQCLHELLDFFVKNVYKAKNADRRVSDWSPREVSARWYCK